MNYTAEQTEDDGDEDDSTEDNEERVLQHAASNTLHLLHQGNLNDFYTYTEPTSQGQEDDHAETYISTNETSINTSTSPHNVLKRTFAASAATEEEDKIAKEGKHPDGSTSVQVAKRIWRPKVRMVYEEPEALLDTSGDLDWLFEEHGRVVIEDKAALPPRNDLVIYNPEKHLKEFEKNIQWRGCPGELQIVLRTIIHKFFDVFAEEGMQNHIRGFEFNIDTGTVKPICCKQPVYGPHESRVIIALVEKLEKKDIVEDDEGPWGSPVVLSSKPDQAHVHWSEFIFRLCVSYRAMNTVTRPFTFPITRCDEAVERVGDAKYYITADLDAGYWQVKMNQSSKEKTAFFIPNGKKHFNSMPMGATNAHAAFVAMVSKMEIKWDKLYETRCKKGKEAEWAWLKAQMESATDEMKRKRAKTENDQDKDKLSRSNRRGNDPSRQIPDLDRR
jgi:hypothetical protein